MNAEEKRMDSKGTNLENKCSHFMTLIYHVIFAKRKPRKTSGDFFLS